jgi:uncharacterized lipoprotein YajG
LDIVSTFNFGKHQKMNTIKINNIKTTTAISMFFILCLTSCANTPLGYKIDPEITTIKQFANQSSLIAISIIDKRTQEQNSANEDITFVPRQKDEAALLRTKLIEILKQNDFRIISNKLLADVSLELEIVEFQVSIETGLFKSNLKVSSQLRVKSSAQGNNFEKLYKMNRTQEVANPVNNKDLSGVVNQLLSKQLSDVWSDPALAQQTKG